VVLLSDDGDYDSMFKVTLVGNFLNGGAGTPATSVDSHPQEKAEYIRPGNRDMAL
jgi:hypothetical protein